MNDILIKSGAYQKNNKSETSRVGGQSVYELINWYLALEDPCCEKNIVATSVTTKDLTVTGTTAYTGGLDINGTELILDADADTSITADTDDQIDIRVAGADDFRITANTLTALSGSTIATNTISETTAASGVTIDGALIKDGGISANNMFAGFFPTTAAQALSGAGAISVATYLTKFTSTGAGNALTIASGTQIGQRKKVLHIVDGGSGVLTGVFVGGTTITFTTANEFADLIWTGTSWGVLELGNYTASGALPALA